MADAGFQKYLITLSVDAQCIQQLGSPQLSPQEAHIQSHEARISALSMCHAGLTSSSHCFRFGQQAMDEVNPGPTHHVNQSILKTERRLVRHQLLLFFLWIVPTETEQQQNIQCNNFMCLIEVLSDNEQGVSYIHLFICGGPPQYQHCPPHIDLLFLLLCLPLSLSLAFPHR